MAPKKELEKEVEETEDLETEVEVDENGDPVEVDESAASETLHPGAGANSGTAPRASIVAGIAGALASVDKSKLKWWEETLKTHFGTDFGQSHTAEGNRSTIKAHPSDAVGTSVKEDIADMFKGQELTEEFKSKATVVFEAAVNAKVNSTLAEMEDVYDDRLNEELESISEELEGKVKTYLEYVAEQWINENEVAIQSALRSEITSEFMSKLRDLFIESNVNIPEDQVEVVDALAAKVEELEGRLAEAIQENAELRETNEGSERQEALSQHLEGLTQLEQEKLTALAEGLEATDVEDFNKKVGILVESLKPSKKSSTVQELLEETNPDSTLAEAAEAEVKLDPAMARYMNAIDRTVPRREKRETV